MRLATFVILLVLAGARAEETPLDLIAALSKSPWPVYPAVPSLSESMRREIASEIAASSATRAAFKDLDPQQDNTKWFHALKALETARAVWSLQACLSHPHSDVQAGALEALGRLKDPKAIHFIILYAEYMAVEVTGSESAATHGILQYDIAQTMSSITGLENRYNRGSREKLMQNPQELRQLVREWRKWELDHSDQSGLTRR